MGLMMSVLVFSIGVLEALSCVEHMRQSLLPLELKRKRRRLVLDVGSGTIRHRETRRSSEFQRDPHAYLRSLTASLPEEDTECEELVAIFEAGRIHSTHTQEPKDSSLLAVSKGVGGRDSREGSELSRVSTPDTVIHNLDDKEEYIDDITIDVKYVNQEIDNNAVFLSSPPESFPINDDLDIPHIEISDKNTYISKKLPNNEYNEILSFSEIIQPKSAEEENLAEFCKMSERKNVALDNVRSEPSPEIAREGLIFDKNAASEIGALRTHSSSDATSTNGSISATPASNLESTIHRHLAGNQSSQQQTLLEARSTLHDSKGGNEPTNLKHSLSADTENRYTSGSLISSTDKHLGEFDTNSEEFVNQTQEKSILDEVAEKVSEWLGFKNDKKDETSVIKNLPVEKDSERTKNDYSHIVSKSEGLQNHEVIESQLQTLPNSVKSQHAINGNDNFKIEENVRNETEKLYLEKVNVILTDKSTCEANLNIPDNVEFENVVSGEVGGKRKVLLDNSSVSKQNKLHETKSASNDKGNQLEEIAVKSCISSEGNLGKLVNNENIDQNEEQELNNGSNEDICVDKSGVSKNSLMQKEEITPELLAHSMSNIQEENELKQSARTEELRKGSSEEKMLKAKALEVVKVENLEQGNDFTMAENKLNEQSSFLLNSTDIITVSDPGDTKTFHFNTEHGTDSVIYIESPKEGPKPDSIGAVKASDNKESPNKIGLSQVIEEHNTHTLTDNNLIITDATNEIYTNAKLPLDVQGKPLEYGIENVMITESFSQAISQKPAHSNDEETINTKLVHESKSGTDIAKGTSSHDSQVQDSLNLQKNTSNSHDIREKQITKEVGEIPMITANASNSSLTQIKNENKLQSESHALQKISSEATVIQKEQPMNVVSAVNRDPETIEITTTNNIQRVEEQDNSNRLSTYDLNVDQNENIITERNITGENVDTRNNLIAESLEVRGPECRRNSSKSLLLEITPELQNTDVKALQELLDVKESLKPVPKNNEQEPETTEYEASSKKVEQRVHRLKSIDEDDVTVLEGASAPPPSTFSPVEDIASPDKAFWLIFSGEYTKAMSKDWHSGHFCCWQCDESLTGQRYVLRDDHPYCIKCYEQVFANTCDECSKVIGIDSKDLSYKDKHWHEACFLCSKCRVSLVDKQFGSKADKIYCGNCYDAQFASRCDGCGQIFRAGTKKMEYKTRQWHEQCFCCCVCKTAIGTKSFIPREQEIYCAGCYEEKFATRCVKCNKIITSGGVTYKNEPWHRECFTCTNCSTSLAGQRFTSRDEKPFCADCFGELFAKRCTACSKPITGIGGTKFISFEDRHWHNDCFICASCRSSLVGRGFITDAEDILCTECAKQKLM